LVGALGTHPRRIAAGEATGKLWTKDDKDHVRLTEQVNRLGQLWGQEDQSYVRKLDELVELFPDLRVFYDVEPVMSHLLRMGFSQEEAGKRMRDAHKRGVYLNLVESARVVEENQQVGGALTVDHVGRLRPTIEASQAGFDLDTLLKVSATQKEGPITKLGAVLGVLIGAAVVLSPLAWVLWNRKASVVFSLHYRSVVIRHTPNVKCKFSSLAVVWIVALVTSSSRTLSEEDKVIVQRARKIQKFLSQPFFVAEQFTGMKGRYVKLEDTIQSFKAVVAGEYDHLPEQAFYMKGDINEVVEAAGEMGKV
jgi:hypothetical protein